MNWIDLLITLLLILNVISGYQKGFVDVLFELVFFALGLGGALRFYPNAAFVLSNYLRLSFGLANFLGFFLVLGLVQIFLSIIFSGIRKKIKDSIKKSPVHPVDKLFGPVPQFVIALVGMSFILALILSYPVSRPIKGSIENSRFGKSLAQPASPALKR